MRIAKTMVAANAIILTSIVALAPCVAYAQDVAVLTPYLSSVTTHEMVDTFNADAGEKGWTTNVVDTHGDMGQLASRMQDEIAAKVDAIVLVSVDPKQIQDQVNAASNAGIPVVTIDAELTHGVALNVTSDNYELGTKLSTFLFKKMGGSGNIVKFYHSAHPGVHQRELALDAALKANPDINVIAAHYVKVPGPINDTRIAMEAMIKRYGDKIDGVWAAWDEPAIGAYLALNEQEPNSDVIIAGADGNPKAIKLIKDCTDIVGTVRQNFKAMGREAADGLVDILEHGAGEPKNKTVPSTIASRDSLGVTCQGG